MKAHESPPRGTSPATSGAVPRIQTIDATRGFAMLLVFLSHFTQIYFAEATPWADSLRWYGLAIGRIASPTFVLTSGLLVGYLYQSRRADWSRVRMKLIDRAIFLATAGHLVIALFVATRMGLSGAIFRGYITDTIAVCIMIGMIIIPRTSRPVRLALAGGLYWIAWIIWSYWNPATHSWTLMVKAALIGPSLAATNVTWFPFIPWVSVYLVGSCLGEYKYLGSLQDKGSYNSVGVTLVKVATGAITLSLVVIAVCAFLEAGTSSSPSVMLSLSQKYPPGPLYLLFFGGIGVLLIGVMFLLARVRRKHVVIQRLAELGQMSLIAYLLQFLVYYTLLTLLVAKTSLTPTGLWPVYWLASIALLFGLVQLSRQVGLNRLCTMGLPFLLREWMRLSVAVQEPAFRLLRRGPQTNAQERKAA